MTIVMLSFNRCKSNIKMYRKENMNFKHKKVDWTFMQWIVFTKRLTSKSMIYVTVNDWQELTETVKKIVWILRLNQISQKFRETCCCSEKLAPQESNFIRAWQVDHELLIKLLKAAYIWITCNFENLSWIHMIRRHQAFMRRCSIKNTKASICWTA